MGCIIHSLCHGFHLFHNFGSSQILNKDIETHRPAVESIRKAVTKLIDSGEPTEVEELKTSLAELNTRYEDVDTTTKRYAEDIDSLMAKLVDFEKKVEEMDDWLVPTIQTVHSKAFGQMPENQLENKIKVCA